MVLFKSDGDLFFVLRQKGDSPIFPNFKKVEKVGSRWREASGKWSEGLFPVQEDHSVSLYKELCAASVTLRKETEEFYHLLWKRSLVAPLRSYQGSELCSSPMVRWSHRTTPLISFPPALLSSYCHNHNSPPFVPLAR